MARRRRFTPRFKAQVALELLREERTVQQFAALHAKLAAEAEVQTPQGKIGQLVVERDFSRAALGR